MGSFRSSAPDLNDRDRGLFADFMVGGKQQKPRRPSSTIQKCAFGEGCRKVVISKNLGNVPMPKPSDFCDIRSPNGGWWDCCAHHQCDADGCYAPRKYNVLKGRHFIYCPKRKLQNITIYSQQSHILQTNALEKAANEVTHRGNNTAPHVYTCVKPDCGVIVEGDEKLCARPAQAIEYEKMANTSHSAHVTRHAQPLSAQETKKPAQSSAPCMNAENRVAISVPAIKHMATAAHITAKSQAATTSK
ncbi:hypothetical protein V500_09622 [Pseudogymnoascus sp. VKM F-4518 (FW-2643)]|nr:hypothetical protein V500_09622 [Pseudogymnoascus sp. VKM F-4518 (FW-2643)]